jgi:probable addiction module antidote protein
MPTKSYDELLLNELRDPEFAAGYLTASLDEGSVDQFLIALRNVAQALGGLGKLAAETELNRQNIYRMLSNSGNPTLGSLLAVLGALGMELSFKPQNDAAA